MAAPSDPLVDWASDPTFAAGADAWSGQVNKTEPPTGTKNEGFTPETKPPAGWFNWVFNNITSWVVHLRDDLIAGLDTIVSGIYDTGTDEFTYPVNKTRLVNIAPSGGRPRNPDTDDWSLSPTSVTGQSPSSWLEFDITNIVPTGATINKIDVSVRPNATATSFACQLLEVTPDYPEVGSVGFVSALDSGTGSAAQVVTIDGTSPSPITALSVVDSSLRFLTLSIQTDATTGVGQAFRIDGIRIEFTDPGPRNF